MSASRTALRLLDAVRKGRESEVNEMLDSSSWGGDGALDGGGAEEEEQVRDAALLWAAMLGHVRVMQALVKSGADVRATDSHGYTPLMWATRGHSHNHALVVRLLLSSGRSEKEARDRHAGWTPFLHAVASGNIETVEALMSAGVDFRARDDAGRTALMIVAGGTTGSTVVGAPGTARGMPCDAKTKLFYESPESRDPQHADDLNEILRKLLATSCARDINAQDSAAPFEGYTALMYAAGSGHSEQVSMLLDADSDPKCDMELRASCGWTALMAASRCGHTDVVMKLLGAGAVVGRDEPIALTGCVVFVSGGA